MRHALTEKDPEARTAVCAIDGPVKIQRSGNGWACGVRANAQSRKQKALRPERDRVSKTEHVLDWQDPGLASGLCRKCGPVDIFPVGRGYACAVRQKELGRVNPQSAPATYCDSCKILDGDIVWLTADGCPRCNDTDLNGMFAQDAADERLLTGHEDYAEIGMHIAGWSDPYEMPELENAVPGWHTIA